MGIERYYFLILLLVPILLSISMTDDVYAASKTVDIPTGTSVPGCEQTDSCFLPFIVSINVGDTVTWKNSDSAAHTVTSGTVADGHDGNFDSSLFMSGASFSHTFDSSGVYPYYCAVHPWMTGAVIVSGSSSTTPTPTPQTTGTINVGGFSVSYQITGGIIISMTPDINQNSLIVEIEAVDDGELTITLPRELIDAKRGDADDDFFVLVDAREVHFNELLGLKHHTTDFEYFNNLQKEFDKLDEMQKKQEEKSVTKGE